MTRDEATEEVVYLKSLFPKMPMEQTDYWQDKFEKYEQDPVRRAINLFADKYSDFVDRTGLLALIESKTTNPEDRIALAQQESAARWAKIRAERETSSVSFAGVDSTLREFSDEDLKALKADVLKDLGRDKPDLAKLLARSDIRTGKVLRYHMAKRVSASIA